MTDAIAFAGYPGSGKSFAGQTVARQAAVPCIEMSSFVEPKCEQQWPDAYREAKRDESETTVSEVVMQFATEMRREYGMGVVGQWTGEHIRNQQPGECVVVNGMRGAEEREQMQEAIEGTVYTVFVHAPFHVRFERVRDRGERGEDGFTVEDLHARDTEEAGWGLPDIAAEADLIVPNVESRETFEQRVFEDVREAGMLP